MDCSTPLRMCHGARIVIAEKHSIFACTLSGQVPLCPPSRLWSELATLLDGTRRRDEIEHWIDAEGYSVTGAELIDRLLVCGIIETATGPAAAMAYHRLSAPACTTSQGPHSLSTKQSECVDRQHRISLPLRAQVTASLEEVLQRRRSVRAYEPEALDLRDLATLLDLAYGSRRSESSVEGDERSIVSRQPIAAAEPLRRPVPSAGALYPLEVYAFALNVNGLQRGLFHYERDEHQLTARDLQDRSRELQTILYDRVDLTSAAAVVAISAVFQRSAIKYGERGYRFVLIEAGHVGQNLLLTAEALDLAALPVGGFVDNALNAFLGVDGHQEAAVYAVVIGRRRDQSRR